jgi:hypothetical protein
MAWTPADADAVRAAITKLAIGERAVSVSYAGPPARSVTYGTANLQELRDLLAEMEAASNGVPRFRRAAFSKGFDR